MPLPTLRAVGLACLLLPLGRLALAQQPTNNDGFLRRNGQMQVVRNGQARPMTHDARLPTGVVVAKDGFVIAAGGQRTELREGQGCDLRGRPVAVRTAASGALALASPAPARASVGPAARPSVLEALLGPAGGEGGYSFNGKKWKKNHGKGHGKGHGRGHRKNEDD
ncbi:hypothetical protein QMK33_08320 [Hymenobacter sp. H14-R3]|uniref:DUF6799 domain-containing protein n=1 Tax=Hymenobacter sp. H14-R3 TaxID=3046308 RepID=UPI0024BBA0A8|nr:DUF6799 domain-containing protein [Hymenobacter sp. H14-R3]MDJ0365155.1 hypothetical protein [Hymenobacter sp. H14-R3]